MDGFLELMEFSLALAGFTSIVVVFAQQNRVWVPFDKFRIGNALFTSLGAAFLAAIPIGLEYLGMEQGRLWQVFSFICGVYLLFVVVIVRVRTMKLLTKEERTLMPKKVVVMLIFGAVVLGVTQIVQAFVPTPWEPQGIIYFGILYLLLISVFAFVRMIFYPPSK